MSMFNLSDFDYHLPGRLIAQQPAHPRDHARLLVYDRNEQTIRDDVFYNLLNYLPKETTLVVNNSRVEKCRLLFDGGRKEIFVVEAVNNRTVRALVRPGKKFKQGQLHQLEGGLAAEVLAVDDEGIRTLRLSVSLDDSALDPYRYTPFPPYITRNEQLAEEYQTIYARDEGSKAAPTAGLHFTEDLLSNIQKQGITIAQLLLHVGLGTFAPVKEENLDHHVMHSEYYEVEETTASALCKAKHITAVGTTSVRVLESNVRPNNGRRFIPEKLNTDIFIRPGYHFQATDALITNFHLPKSTLLMLVAAFMGYEEMQRVYRHAIQQEYRFYSFGDAMLIL